MANQEHVEILEYSVEDWNQWREENPDKRPDLSSAELYGADLGGADLAGADLRGAHLFRADLVDANLCRANLDGADLFVADLSRADLSGTSLIEANLQLPTSAGRPGTSANTNRPADQRSNAARW